MAGRPPIEYSEKYHPLWVRSLSRRGLTFEEVAREIGVSRPTLRKWLKAFPELFAALKEGKGEADSRVEDSLFRRALGFECEETKAIGTPDSRGTIKTHRVEKTKKQVLPDVTAQIFWLKNRRPDLWRDVQKIEHAGRISVSTIADLVAEAEEDDGKRRPEDGAP